MLEHTDSIVQNHAPDEGATLVVAFEANRNSACATRARALSPFRLHLRGRVVVAMTGHVKVVRPFILTKHASEEKERRV